MDEVSVDGIKSLMQVHFQYTSWRDVLSLITSSNVLTDEDIIKDFPSWYESRLTGVNKMQ